MTITAHHSTFHKVKRFIQHNWEMNQSRKVYTDSVAARLREKIKVTTYSREREAALSRNILICVSKRCQQSKQRSTCIVVLINFMPILGDCGIKETV